MSTIVHSACTEAMQTQMLTIESKVCRGFSGVQLLGNVSEVCRDGKERAKAGLESAGITVPANRILLSFTPADVRKDGNHLDLPMAVSLALLLNDRESTISANEWLFAAEIGLQGQLLPVRGVVAAALTAMAHRLKGVVVATENRHELDSVQNCLPADAPPLQVMGFHHLRDVIDWLYGRRQNDDQTSPDRSASDDALTQPDFDDMRLEPSVRLAAEVAAAGMHSVLLRGTPGCGKSMFAARMPSIMPQMSGTMHLEAMRIHSSRFERLPNWLLAGRVPFRQPHHNCSASAVLGSAEAAGELALAHGGILFLDELPEFRRDVLESLREPLETGEVYISRAKLKLRWSARIMLVAACNNCPCGYHGSKVRMCFCGQSKLLAYQQRLSGPVLQRIDMHINMPEPSGAVTKFLVAGQSERFESQTEDMRERVQRARRFAADRWQSLGVVCNAALPQRLLRNVSGLAEDKFEKLLRATIPGWASGRAVVRCLRVARTLADLDERQAVDEQDLRQAWGWQSDQAAIERGDELGIN